ncbi:PAS domain-containing sensor histidine kinase [Arcobacter sp. YIC-310]|uniref:PAS domain-containing sensor histidine kinase n=1 Tax=Arcobacter sp. YIC-310 TaxID=3376632 RepID=UPI003C185F8B
MKNNFLKFLIENSSDIAYEINLETKEINWHKDLNALLEYDKSKNLSDIDSFIQIIKKSHRNIFLEKLTINDTEKRSIKYKIKKNNKEFQEWIDTFIKDGNKIFGVCKINYKKLSLELKRSKKRYQKLFEANKIPVLVTSLKTGKIIKANKAANKFYGYTSKEFKKLHITDINTLPYEDLQKDIQKALTDEKECFNFKHKIKTGKIIDVEVYTGPISLKKENLIYSIVFDITKRKQALKKLKLSDTIYENTKEGIFITDLETRFLSVNKAFEDITGYKEEEVLHKKVKILKSNKHSKAFYNNLWSSIKSKGSWEGEITNRNKKGELFHQWVTINTVYDENNKPINYISVFTDFTKLKEQEQLLREKDKIMFQQSKMASMGEMLKNIAHQWRQPLSVITSSASGLKLKKEFGILSDEDFSEFAEGILKSTNYLSQTIDDFSNYFKNSSDKEVFHVNNVIEKAIQLTDSSLKSYDISIQTQFNDNCEIYGIKNELIQVLLNIINNAKDAYKDKNKNQQIVQIESKKELLNACIIIKDYAGGINENIIDKIFEPYFTTKHQSQGTGIGLYMSKQIIEDRLNGSISVENIQKEEEKGVAFKILVPISKKS